MQKHTHIYSFIKCNLTVLPDKTVNTTIVRSIPSSILYGPSWSWSHGSWIYNHMCNQCLLPLKVWVH